MANNTSHSKTKPIIAVIIAAVLIILSGLAGFFIGAHKTTDVESETQTFYATIESISGDTILVEGLDVNDINYRSKFTFRVKDTTILEWRHEAVSASDLKVGDRVSITFTGEILESYPAQLTNVTKVQILSDDK